MKQISSKSLIKWCVAGVLIFLMGTCWGSLNTSDEKRQTKNNRTETDTIMQSHEVNNKEIVEKKSKQMVTPTPPAEDNKVYKESNVDIKPSLTYNGETSYQKSDYDYLEGHEPPLYKYIENNLPEDDDWVSNAEFIAHFIVEKDGRMSNISVTCNEARGNGIVTPYCKKLATTLRKGSGNALKWKPGKINGEPVRVKLSVRIWLYE